MDFRFLISSLVCFVLIVLGAVVSYYFGVFFTLIVLAVFLYYLYVVFDCYPVLLIMLLSFVVMRLTELGSGVLIETGSYMVETSKWGVGEGAFSLLALYYFLFLFFVALFWRAFYRGERSGSDSGLFVVVSVTYSVVVLLCGVFAGLIEGFALLQGQNRFAFRVDSGSFLLDLFLNNRLAALLLLGAIFSSIDGSRARYVVAALAVLIIGVSMLHGEQFTSVVSSGLGVMMFPLIFLVLNGGGAKAAISKTVALVVSVGLLVLFVVYGAQGVDALELLSNRVVLQGQMWAVAYDDVDEFFSLNDFGRNISTLLCFSSSCLTESYVPAGMRAFMFDYADGWVYDAYMDNNVTFTMGQMAVLLYWFGYLGMIPFVIGTAAVFSAVLLYLYSSVSKGDFVSSILSIKLYSWVVFGLQQGEYWYLFGVKVALFVVVILCYEFFPWSRMFRYRVV